MTIHEAVYIVRMAGGTIHLNDYIEKSGVRFRNALERAVRRKLLSLSGKRPTKETYSLVRHAAAVVERASDDASQELLRRST